MRTIDSLAGCRVQRSLLSLIVVCLGLLSSPGPSGAATAGTLTPHEVCLLQEKLRDAGTYSGPADGVRGPNTNNAMEDYARRYGLHGSTPREIYAHALSNPEIRSTLRTLPLPETGHRFGRPARNAMAPLQIATSDSGHHYFVKVTLPDSTKSVATVFIRSGEETEIRVPLGRYVVKYAVGTSWRGSHCLFGVDTGFHKADQFLHFVRDGDRVSGFRIELILRTSGNLRTRGIGSGDF